jgi:hypothetical protein
MQAALTKERKGIQSIQQAADNRVKQAFDASERSVNRIREQMRELQQRLKSS